MKTAAVRSRIQLRNILLATDFSHAAASAQTFAAEIAQRFGANLIAVHAKTPENYALPATEVWPALNAELEKEAEELKVSLRRQCPGLQTEVVLADGGVWPVVEAVAQERNADLIVVGTSGRDGIGRFLLGSIAEQIIRQAKCPVLAVGPHAQFGASREASFKKIVFATDFGEGSRVAAGYAVALAQEHQAHLTLLHVIEHPKAGDLVHPRELEEAAVLSLLGLVPHEAELWCEPKTVVRHGMPAEKILEVAEKEQADLIVLGLREGKGVGRATHLTNVAHQVLSLATCPVLTVRP
jgi:nucleotide-binding universal stress UspA family protein